MKYLASYEVQHNIQLRLKLIYIYIYIYIYICILYRFVMASEHSDCISWANELELFWEESCDSKLMLLIIISHRIFIIQTYFYYSNIYLPRIVSSILVNCYQWGSCVPCEKYTKEPSLSVNFAGKSTLSLR